MLSILNYSRSFLDYFRYYVRISYTYKLATDIEGYFIYTGSGEISTLYLNRIESVSSLIGYRNVDLHSAIALAD